VARVKRFAVDDVLTKALREEVLELPGAFGHVLIGL
jgi:hypothetical protein